MKRLLCMMVAVALLLSFCACASDPPSAEDGTEGSTDAPAAQPPTTEGGDPPKTDPPGTSNGGSSLPVAKREVTNLFVPATATAGYYMDQTGTQTASTLYSYSDTISVTAGDVIYVAGIDKSVSIPLVAIYGEDAQFSRSLFLADLSFVYSFDSGLYIMKFTVPAGAASIRLNFETRYLAHTLVTKNELFYSETYDRWYGSSLAEGANCWNTMCCANTSGYIPVQAGDKLYIAAFRPNQNTALGATYTDPFRENETITASTSYKKLRDINMFSMTLEYMVSDTYGIYSYTVPLDAEYVRIADAPQSVLRHMYISKNKPIEKTAYLSYCGYNNVVDTESPLYGKSALFLGDSITYGTGEDDGLYCSWAGRLGAKYGMTVLNAGDPGARVSQTGPSGFIIDGLNKWTAADAPDMIVMHGGVNDAIREVEIGQISTNGSFDTQTFAGGLEAMFQKAKTLYPTSDLFYITNYRLDGNDRGYAKDMSGYFSIAKEICQKYGVTVIDLYENEELNSILQPTTKKYLPDLLHANSAAYDIILPYIASALETYYEAS